MEKMVRWRGDSTPKEEGESLKDKVKSIGKKTEEKTKEIKDKSMQSMHIGPAKDGQDIHALGTTRLEKLTADFEARKAINSL